MFELNLSAIDEENQKSFISDEVLDSVRSVKNPHEIQEINLQNRDYSYFRSLNDRKTKIMIQCNNFEKQFSLMVKKRQSYGLQLLKQFILFSSLEGFSSPDQNYRYLRTELEKAVEKIQSIYTLGYKIRVGKAFQDIKDSIIKKQKMYRNEGYLIQFCKKINLCLKKSERQRVMKFFEALKTNKQYSDEIDLSTEGHTYKNYEITQKIRKNSFQKNNIPNFETKRSKTHHSKPKDSYEMPSEQTDLLNQLNKQQYNDIQSYSFNSTLQLKNSSLNRTKNLKHRKIINNDFQQNIHNLIDKKMNILQNSPNFLQKNKFMTQYSQEQYSDLVGISSVDYTKNSINHLRTHKKRSKENSHYQEPKKQSKYKKVINPHYYIEKLIIVNDKNDYTEKMKKNKSTNMGKSTHKRSYRRQSNEHRDKQMICADCKYCVSQKMVLKSYEKVHYSFRR